MSARLPPSGAGVTYSTKNGLVELSAPLATKATGLPTVVADFGLGARTFIPFGDMPNVIPMLFWAGRGVVMGNAHSAAVAVADEFAAPSMMKGSRKCWNGGGHESGSPTAPLQLTGRHDVSRQCDDVAHACPGNWRCRIHRFNPDRAPHR